MSVTVFSDKNVIQFQSVVDRYSYSSLVNSSKAPFPLPELTARVDGQHSNITVNTLAHLQLG